MSLPRKAGSAGCAATALAAKPRTSDLAHAYLDAVLDPESIANLASDFWYGASNTKATEFMPADVVERFQLDDPDVLSQTVFYKTLTAENREKITTTWDEVKITP